jgi:hypothetical protein
MMKCWLLACIALLASTGCGRQTANVNLPDWAPKNQSSGFIKAATVLQSFPSDPAQQAENARVHQTLVPAWEFFGSLDDSQIGSLRANKQIRIPCGSLSENQRKALNNYFETYRQIRKDAPPSADWPSDMLAELIKRGAKQDLSNVDILIDVRANNLVRLACVIRRQDGSVSNPLPITGLGTMR